MTTPTYGMFEPDDNTPMSNPVPFMGDNWAKIENIPRQPILAALPSSDFSYKYGDKIFRTAYNSTFICMGSNADWGVFWRPVHAKFGPWVTCTNAVLADIVGYNIGAQPLQYRIASDGRFQMRGSVLRAAGQGAFPDFEVSGTLNMLKPITPSEGPGVAPFFTGTFPLTLADSPASPAKPQVAFASISPTGNWVIRTWNSAGTATQLYFSGVEWEIQNSSGYAV